MRKTSDALTVTAVDTIEAPVEVAESPEAEDAKPISFPTRVRGQYATVVVNTAPAIIRLLRLPGKTDSDLETRVIEGLGIENPEEYRISYSVLAEETAGRNDTQLVAVAYPEPLVLNALALLPTSGTPAPRSIEVAGLATMNALMNGPAVARSKDTLGLIDFGDTSTLFAFIHRGMPVLIRKLDRGTKDLLDKVESSLGVNRETAVGIISDRSFDISAAAAEVLQPLVRQLVVSRDFIERRENCKVDAVYLAGGLAQSHDTQNEVNRAMGVSVESWNPFAEITTDDNAVPDALKGHEWRFTACAGACMATFEDQ